MLHGFNRDQPFFRRIALAAKEVGGDNVVDKVTLLENYWRGGKGRCARAMLVSYRLTVIR